MYYFPSPFIENEIIDISSEKLNTTVNSGKNALRLVLRNLDLPKGSTIGMPAFCCNEVLNAVLEEEFTPYFFDLKEPGSYWANYTLKTKNGIEAIIITHLYGYVHPDTTEIIKFCITNNIKLIHDAAQSYGIDVSLFGNAPVIYSFGPGKSTTAALGGEIINLSKTDQTSFKTQGFWNNVKAKTFFNARLYNYKNNKWHSIKSKLAGKFATDGTAIFGMSDFQKKKALEAKAIVHTKKEEREKRYQILKQGISKLQTIKVGYENSNGLFFKLVLYIENNVDRFLAHLKKNNVPYVRLAENMDMSKRNISHTAFFKETYLNIIELSTERSIPISEIERVSRILSEYKNEN